MLNVADRLAVIIGGGAVAVRKATGLLAAGAGRVRVVSPTFDPAMPANIERLTTTFQPSHLDDADLVFAATDHPEVNAAVAAAAAERGIWVCRADADADADFSTPAVARAGSITITVSAAGNPAIAASLRDQIQTDLDPRWIDLAAAAAKLRPAILASGLSPIERKKILQDLATEEAAAHASDLQSWIEQRINRKLSV
jgi:precorrin-2 dehydrogenase / sirohydrochlorin ferrochelatase